MSRLKIHFNLYFDAEGFTSSQILREALEYCLTIDCHIINLSLSLLDEDNYEIKEICDELLKQNKVVVSAVRNRYKLSEPAIFDSVLGVRGSLFPSPNEFWFNSHKTIQLITDMTPFLLTRTRKVFCVLRQ